MKKQLQGFYVGILFTAVTFGIVTTALAASGAVSFNSVNLRFNGQQISAKGEDYRLDSGASVPASILYTDENGGGTTYLPIARISELLNVEIGWDGATESVRIGEEPGAASPASESNVGATASGDYSDWSEEKEAAYQEFKALWEIEFINGASSIMRADGEIINTPWERYRMTTNKLLTYDELSNLLTPAKNQGFVERIANEVRTSNKIIRVEISFRSQNNILSTVYYTFEF